MIDDFLLVQGGAFQEAGFRALLAGARYPARSPDVNVADIKAQVAANQRGVQELSRVVDAYGWDTVRDYMRHVMDNAEEAVRRVLSRIGDGAFSYTMDDGTPLQVAVTVDQAARTATVDFTGTGPQRPGNFNAPPAVLRAVVLYVFRCLVGQDIPLNDGCLVPIRIVLPLGTFLSPRPRRRRGGGQHRGQPSRLQRPARRAGRPGVQPGDDEQRAVRRCHAPVLRDHLRRHGRRPRPLRRQRGADAHDQHPHDRPGGAGAARPLPLPAGCAAACLATGRLTSAAAQSPAVAAAASWLAAGRLTSVNVLAPAAAAAACKEALEGRPLFRLPVEVAAGSTPPPTGGAGALTTGTTTPPLGVAPLACGAPAAAKDCASG